VAVGKVSLDQLRSAARTANVVICVLDAARADHIGCYGYPRDTTPSIDRLAEESVVFMNHFATYPATKASTVSLLTGLYPDTHLAVGQGGSGAAGSTLEQRLKAAGFETAFLSSNVVASPLVGVGADFDRVFVSRYARARGQTKRSARPEEDALQKPEALSRVFGQWLAGARASRFLAYCHFLPPHSPYEAPEAMQQLFAGERLPLRQGRFEFPETRPPYGMSRPPMPQQWVNLYDANMRWADWGVGEVLRLLREQNLLDNTLLIVTSDHGEAFAEHGYTFHTHAVYDELVHIPLLIRFPGQQRPAGQVTALTQSVDLLPTILDLFRVPYPRERVQGVSLLPLLGGEKSKVRDYVFATCADPWPSYLVRDSEWSLILYRGGKLRALYDLRADPGQTQNVIDAHPEVAAKMIAAFQMFARTQRRSLAAFISPSAAPAPARPPESKPAPETQRELRALGYLD
jgi:arylsulfatase